MSSLVQLPYDGRSLGIIEFHTDLHKRFLLREAVQKRISLFGTREIAGYDHIFIHYSLFIIH